MGKGVEELRDEIAKHQRRARVMIDNGVYINDVDKLIELHTNILNELNSINELREKIKELR